MRILWSLYLIDVRHKTKDIRFESMVYLVENQDKL